MGLDIYTWTTWNQLVQFSRSLKRYGVYANVASLIESEMECQYDLQLYIDKIPYPQGNIDILIISSNGDIIQLIAHL
mgnify:CR=1 FL=1